MPPLALTIRNAGRSVSSTQRAQPPRDLAGGPSVVRFGAVIEIERRCLDQAGRFGSAYCGSPAVRIDMSFHRGSIMLTARGRRCRLENVRLGSISLISLKA